MATESFRKLLTPGPECELPTAYQGKLRQETGIFKITGIQTVTKILQVGSITVVD